MKTYGVILADPPWSWKARSKKGEKRSAKNHYHVMESDDICNLPVGDHAAPDCVLFIWVLNSMLDRGLRVIDAWGFAYKTVGFVWVKQNKRGRGLFMGLGYHTRQNAELCLIATRGKPKRLNADVHQIIMAPRREHSRKPDETYDRIERLYSGPYLELFSRTNRAGWDQLGNETGKWHMKKSPTSISAAGSGDSPSQSQTVDEEQIEMFAPPPSVSQTSSASKSSTNTGLTSQSTMMSKPSQKTSAKSQSSQRDTLANHFPKLGSAKARQMTVTSGRGCLKLLSKQDPAYAFLKMLLVTSQWESTRCYLTWKMKVTMRGRSYLEQSPKTPRTADKESGLLHTTWPTPSATPRGPHTGSIKGSVSSTGMSRTSAKGVKWGATLETAVKMWPTPTKRDHKGGYQGGRIRNGKVSRASLDVAVQATDNPNGTSGQLSADWVELLMGYPPGWTKIGNGELPE